MGEARAGAVRGQNARYGLVVACYGASDPAFVEGWAVPLMWEARDALTVARGVSVDDLACRIAFTSPGVRTALAARGVAVADVAGALDDLARAGVCEVAVASAHLVAGGSYRALADAASWAEARGCAVRVAAPLLADADDAICLARALTDRYPAEPGRAVVLVGHGAAGAAQLSYAALQAYLAAQGRADVLVGTLRGRPGAEEVMAELAALGCRRVLLAPLMLAAGVHAARDIGGTGAGSWCVRLAAAGYEVTVAPEGLAELPAVRELAVRHVLAAVSQPAEDAADVRPQLPLRNAAGGAVAGFGVSPGARSEGAARPPRFPLFVSLAGARCLVAGFGAVGERRARALARFGAEVLVVDPRGAASVGAEADAPHVNDAAGDVGLTAKASHASRVAGGAPHEPAAACDEGDAPSRLVLPASGGGRIVVAARAYREGDEEGCALVVAATSDRAVNRHIGARCRERGIPVSVADAPEKGTFFFPALCEGERLVAGIVSRDGAHTDHALVARAARDVRGILP